MAMQDQTITQAVDAPPGSLLLTGLTPTPQAEWERMREFLSFSGEERRAMVETVPALFRRGYGLVVDSYDHLLENGETARILGWEGGADPAHLEERRRFLTIWLARLLGLDFSHELAGYLFAAGKMHDGHGPRRVHVPPVYVTGAISLVTAGFARILAEEMPASPAVPLALAGWNKTLSLHLHMMLMGYEASRALAEGSFALPVRFYSRMRKLTGVEAITVGAADNLPLARVIEKIFNFFPQARADALEQAWLTGEHSDAFGNPWLTVSPVYSPRRGWRVLINGRDTAYLPAGRQVVCPGDEVQVFPPGR